MAGAHDGPQLQDIGQRLHAQGVGASTGPSAPESNMQETVAQYFIGLFKKLTGVDASNPQASGISHLDSKGFTDNPINKAAGSLSVKREGIASKLLGKHITREASINSQETLAQVAPASHGEAPHQPDFHAMLGDASAMGKYSVADIAGGAPTSSNAPNFGGGSIHLA